MRKHSQHFKLVFFTINLHFVTSDQVSKYRNAQKRFKQTKVNRYATFSEKKRPTKLRKRFSPAWILLMRLAWIIFIPCYNWMILLFKLIVTLRLVLLSYCCFPWSQFFERNPYFMCYLHNTKVVTIFVFVAVADFCL